MTIPFVAVCLVTGLLYGGPDASEHSLVRFEIHPRACDETVVKSATKDGLLIIESPWIGCRVVVPVEPGQGWQPFAWLLGRPIAFIAGKPVKVVLTGGQQRV